MAFRTQTPPADGEALAAQLFTAEAAIDAALVEAANLMALLPQARAQAYLSAVTGQRVFEDVAASISSLTQARAHMVATHNGLAALARKMGLDTLAVGPLDKPEDRPQNGADRTNGSAREMVNKSLPVSPDTC